MTMKIFYVLMIHISSFVSVQIFCPFFSWVVYLLKFERFFLCSRSKYFIIQGEGISSFTWNTEFILILLFINNYIILYINNGTFTFAPPCICNFQIFFSLSVSTLLTQLSQSKYWWTPNFLFLLSFGVMSKNLN